MAFGIFLSTVFRLPSPVRRTGKTVPKFAEGPAVCRWSWIRHSVTLWFRHISCNSSVVGIARVCIPLGEMVQSCESRFFSSFGEIGRYAPATEYPRDPSQEIKVSPEALTDLLSAIFVKKSVFAADAKIAAARLVEADMRGMHSHGCRMIPWYLEGIDEGHIDPRAHVLTIFETPAMATLDGGRALGQVAATKAMELAISRLEKLAREPSRSRTATTWGPRAFMSNWQSMPA
jgi:hypothetical protein